jgi:GT2 family glycosyltransferase/glycosyltransferase involved in cell wall biosynthesis
MPVPEDDEALARSGLANAAMDRGQAEAARGDIAAARRWFDRASRLLPGDDTAALLLAGTCLGHDDLRAAELFAGIVSRQDVREAWLGLALARLHLGDVAAAAAALGAALSRFVVDQLPQVAGIADRIVRQAGAAGWCGIGPGGALLTSPSGQASLMLDGSPVVARGGRLPSGWLSAKRLDIRRNGDALLGSPIDLAAICRVEGCVWQRDGALEGWAWHPGNPAADPRLTIETAARGAKPLRIAAKDLDVKVAGGGVLARPRRFVVPSALLENLAGPVCVLGSDGRHLSGSPLDASAPRREAIAAALAVAARFPAGTGSSRRGHGADVVIPVYGGGEVTLDCIRSVLAALPRGSRVVVVDDASPEPELARELDRMAGKRLIRLIRHPANLGFPASANAGLRACAGHDVVLLNSDTLVPEGWLERLRAAAYSAGNIGSVTPLSNDATILSYPHLSGGNPTPSVVETVDFDRIAAAANGGLVVDIPTAVGFCMYIRRDCLDQAGALREDLFAQGYGEENDFCVRARDLGWRHVAAPGVYVGHHAGQSFGDARTHLLARNAEVLDRLHPGYGRLIAEHGLADPLAGARRRMDLLRWKQGRQRGAGRSAMILITHFHGGGTERQIGVQCAAARAAGQRPVVLRPARLADGSAAVMVGEGEATDYPNLRFAMPAELPALVRLLAAERPVGAQLHHLLGHDPAVLQVIGQLGIPYDVHVHDSAAFCPRVGLLGPDRRYCGEPEIAGCEACIADIGRKDGLDIPVAELRRRSAGILGAALRVLVPSQDTAMRINRHFPAVKPVMVPHGDDAAIADPPAPRPVLQGGGRSICRVAVIGAIGLEKGYEVLLACARDAAWRDLPVEFVVIGHSIDDKRLLATGRVFVTGEYRAQEAVGLIRAQQASIAWVTSIWPETWCFTLTEAWQAGLQAACFDIGAPAERIRRSGRGLVLPLGLPAGSINHALVAATSLASG